MTIDALPEAPDPNDSASVFNAKAFALLAALEDFVTQTNATAVEVDADAAAAAASASTATTKAAEASASESAAAGSAIAAATSAGAILWVSGTTYAIGDARRCPTSLRVYNRRTAGAGTTVPSLDPTNWKIASTGGLPDVPYSGTTATVSLGERSRFTNVAAVAVTVPAPTGPGEEWAGIWDNGLFTNSYDLGGASLTHNGITRSGVITNNIRRQIHLISVGANDWRRAP